MKKYFLSAIIIIGLIFFSGVILNAQDSMNDESEVATEEEYTEETAESPEVTEEAAEMPEESVATVDENKSAKDYVADLSSDDENKIIKAADWLGNKKEKSAVSKLMELLKSDKRVKVRLWSSIALGLIADESSIPVLNEALTGDSNADVRYSVLLAIHRIDPSKSLDALKKAKEQESDPYIKDYIDKMEAKWRGK